MLTACQTTAGRTGYVNLSDNDHDIAVKIPRSAPSIQSDYGARIAVNGYGIRRVFHNGVDIVAPRGYPIIAPMGGVVAQVSRTKRNGLIVFISHGEIDSIPLGTAYYHMEDAVVAVGDAVTRGQKIGTVGDSGETSGGVTHLHFIVQYAGRPSNPHQFWIGGMGIIECYDRAVDYRPVNFNALTYPVPCVE
jgi:murein DD-endopeptidase MepM/ murein hydrolase activator NlpD